ncbi:MAG: 4-hydroxy-tetrahydrodipicolinate reductase [Rickettsiaceae bacterium H1]|nr:4-hydroxy-tetrahydrodipicolinate reductase [Rickettsiaceae bacterium H1]
MNKVKIGVVGYMGRMGKQITSVILESEQAILSSCVSRTKSKKLSKNNVKIAKSISEVCRDANVVIEFTNPITMKECLATAQETKTPLVSGTTGHDNYELMKQVAKTTPIIWAANMSLGINVLSKIVMEVANALNEDYDIEISEIHHVHKKDFPSGTAIMLGKASAKGRDVDFESKKSIYRNTIRKKGEIGFSSLRGGGIFGEHKVMFIAEDEYLELSHVALTRKLFAKGAVKGALWLYDKKPGLYSMQNVLKK